MSGRVGGVTTDSSIIDADTLVNGDSSTKISVASEVIDPELARQTEKADKLYKEKQQLIAEIKKIVHNLDEIQGRNTTEVIFSFSPQEESVDLPGLSPELIKKNQEVAELTRINAGILKKRDALANELAHELTSRTITIVRRPQFTADDYVGYVRGRKRRGASSGCANGIM